MRVNHQKRNITGTHKTPHVTNTQNAYPLHTFTVMDIPPPVLPPKTAQQKQQTAPNFTQYILSPIFTCDDCYSTFESQASIDDEGDPCIILQKMTKSRPVTPQPDQTNQNNTTNYNQIPTIHEIAQPETPHTLDSSHNINQTNPETLPTTQQTPHHHQYGQQMDNHSTLITPEQQMYTGEPYNIPDTYNNHYYQPPYYHQYQYETNYTPQYTHYHQPQQQTAHTYESIQQRLQQFNTTITNNKLLPTPATSPEYNTQQITT